MNHVMPCQPGYYHVTIGSFWHGRCLGTNGERALVVSQLQDVLGSRLQLPENPVINPYSVCVDLLAFSITGKGISLVLFAIERPLVRSLAYHLEQSLKKYRGGQQSSARPVSDFTRSIRWLTGPHEALAASVELHRRHQDWEYDRYSSIGFYLHDRRGDWMRVWRLARLYNNDPALYYRLMVAEKPGRPNFTKWSLPFATS